MPRTDTAGGGGQAQPGPPFCLSAVDLACERGGSRLFASLEVSLGAGELLRVRGPNGSGKTSLLRILAGLSRPASGTVLWNQQPVDSLAEEYGLAMLFIGHAQAANDDLTAIENLGFTAALSGLATDSGSLHRALERFGIARRAHVPVRFLSAGQKRRVALARLVLGRSRPLWILDEPFAALDSAVIDELALLLSSHLRDGGLVVLTSHQDVTLTAGRLHEIDFAGARA